MPNRSLKFILTLLAIPVSAFAQFDEGGFHQALKIKKGAYLSDGSVSGGDRTASDFRVIGVRVAKNPAGYDRLVIDLSNPRHPPFFLVQNDSSGHRILATLYGKAKLDFSTQAALQAARKTRTIKKMEFLPLVEEDRWMMALEVQGSVKMEVFELTTPARIIIDLKP